MGGRTALLNYGPEVGVAFDQFVRLALALAWPAFFFLRPRVSVGTSFTVWAAVYCIGS